MDTTTDQESTYTVYGFRTTPPTPGYESKEVCSSVWRGDRETATPIFAPIIKWIIGNNTLQWSVYSVELIV